MSAMLATAPHTTRMGASPDEAAAIEGFGLPAELVTILLALSKFNFGGLIAVLAKYSADLPKLVTAYHSGMLPLILFLYTDSLALVADLRVLFTGAGPAVVMPS